MNTRSNTCWALLPHDGVCFTNVRQDGSCPNVGSHADTLAKVIFDLTTARNAPSRLSLVPNAWGPLVVAGGVAA